MKIDDDSPPTVPEWTVTFGDLMTILLTFFVMLVSMSEFKKTDRFQRVADSLERRFGGAGEQRLPERDPRIADLIEQGRSRREALLASERPATTKQR
jgi:chemotaxis protein MotB